MLKIRQCDWWNNLQTHVILKSCPTYFRGQCICPDLTEMVQCCPCQKQRLGKLVCTRFLFFPHCNHQSQRWPTIVGFRKILRNSALTRHSLQDFELHMPQVGNRRQKRSLVSFWSFPVPRNSIKGVVCSCIFFCNKVCALRDQVKLPPPTIFRNDSGAYLSARRQQVP